jgi:hypothetical protein
MAGRAEMGDKSPWPTTYSDIANLIAERDALLDACRCARKELAVGDHQHAAQILFLAIAKVESRSLPTPPCEECEACEESPRAVE